MSLRAIRWALQQHTGNSSAKVVLIILAEAADTIGQAAVGQRQIIEGSELAERTVRAALVILETAGLIRREARYRDGGGREIDNFQLSIPATAAGIKAADPAGMIPATAAAMVGSIPATAAGMTVLFTSIPPHPPLVPPAPPLPAVGGSLKNAEKSRKHLLPPDWAPNEAHCKLADELGLSVMVEAEKMRDWAASNAVKKADWNATFRNWLRNSRSKGKVAGIHLGPEEFKRQVEPVPTEKTRMQVEHERKRGLVK